MNKMIGRIVNFLRDIFWIDRIAYVGNYRNNRKGFLYYALYIYSKIAYYMYYLLIVILVLYLVAGDITFLVHIVLIVLWPLMYRITMGFQVLIHRVGKKTNYSQTRNLSEYKYMFRLKPLYDILVFIILGFVFISSGLISFQYSFTSDNWYIYSDNAMSLFTIVSLVLIIRLYIIRVPAIRMSSDKVQYSNFMFFFKTIQTEDIKKVYIDKNHYNKRVVVQTKGKSYYIDTLYLSADQEDVKSTIKAVKKHVNHQ